MKMKAAGVLILVTKKFTRGVKLAKLTSRFSQGEAEAVINTYRVDGFDFKTHSTLKYVHNR